jgi:dihydrofolate reductase
MILNLIAAASTNNVIGKNNQLLWHLPNDIKFFKNTTWAMPVIMGRKTYESMKAEPLPGRFNFVLSRQKEWSPTNEKVSCTHSLSRAIELAKETDCKETFVIGGGQVYAEAMAHASKIYLTRVDVILEGDAWFPVIEEKEWQLTSKLDLPGDAKHAFAYSFQLWERK